MKQRMSALRVCIILVATAAVWGPSYGQPDDGGSRAGEDANAAAGREDVPSPQESVRDLQWTPVPPGYVPFGTALRERRAAARAQLRSAVDRRAVAVQQAKAGEEIRALDAQIEEWQRKIAAVQSEMDLGNVPEHPVTPRPQTRAAPSTVP